MTTLKYISAFLFLCCFSGNAQSAYFISSINMAQINDMAQSGDTLWLATDSGIVKLNTIAKTSTFYQHQLGGKANKFNRILHKNGNLWAASDTNGLWQLHSGNWTNFNTQNGLASNRVLDLAITRDSSLWVATAQGLVAKKGTNFTTHIPFQNNFITAIASFGDSLVAGNHAGNEPVKLFANNSWSSLPSSSSPGNYINQLFIDAEGVIYKYSTYGFQELNGTTWINPLSKNILGSICSEEGDFPIALSNNQADAFLKTQQAWEEIPDFLQTANSSSTVNFTSLYPTDARSFWCSLTIDGQQVLAHYFNFPNQTSTKKLNANALSGKFWADGRFFGNGTELDSNAELRYKNKRIVYANFLKMTGWSSNRNNRQTLNQSYSNSGKPAFVSGPISNQRHKKSFYEKYNRVWKVSRQEIETHIANHQNPGFMPAPDILNWPGNGDVSQGESKFIAPFIDQNFNGIYEPMQGDYPDILGDEAVFMVYNAAQGVADFGQENIDAEFHTLVYAFDSAGTAAHHAIFANQKILFPTQSFDTLIIGQFIDFDLGNSYDDFTGCDSTKNLAYVYNGDNDDEGSLGFGLNPPAAGFISLSQPLSGFIAENGTPISAHNVEQETFYTLNSLWADGSPIRVENPSGLGGNQNGDGHNAALTDPITKFQYNAAALWYQSTKATPDVRTHAMQQFTNISPGAELCLSFAYFVARDSSWNDIPTTLGNLYDNANWIQNFYDHEMVACLGAEMGFEENAQVKNWTVGPNPSQGIFELTALDNFKHARFTVVNLMGQVVAENKIANKTTRINLSHLPSGVYLLQVVDAANISFTERLVIAH